MDPHELGELRSLELHRVVGARLRERPDLVERACARVDVLEASGVMHGRYAEEWRSLLRGPLEELLRALSDPAKSSLRSTSPFAGMVSPRERWHIWREVRRA
ncbi:MAG: hypothetical protein HYV07_32260 [Deltaproteobacteria bacterium]|nr:hypothetical protein [Deltaproteobacteria bacterium]